MIYKFNKEDCWYKTICEDYSTDICKNGCLRHLEMFYLMHNSGIPKNLQKINKLIPEDCDLESFRKLKEIKQNIKKFIETGKNLYIYSEFFGNGKTIWAIKLMQAYFDKVWYGNRYKTRGLFIKVPTFLLNLRNNISNKNEEFLELLDLISEVDLIIWDDISSVNLKDYDQMNLFSYIDERLSNGLSNIFTDNTKDEKSFINVVGGRLASRIYTNSIKIKLFGKDKRCFNGIIEEFK